MKINTVAMLLAGGQGTRLYDLTTEIAKPAVEFGGRYRIIDFPLSNCKHSGITTVGVVTQYRPLLLHKYINGGSTWDLDHEQGGVHILPPYTTSDENYWFKGTAHAIWANYNFIDSFDPKYVLILSGDHIYNMDYDKLIKEHEKRDNDLTICVKPVPIEEASRFGIMTVDNNNMITEFNEKPEVPNSDLASMGIYVFNREVLHKYLSTESGVEGTEFDFGKNIIPRMMEDKCRVGSYKFSGYWKDVGTIESLWEANMDLLHPRGDQVINNSNWRVYSKTPALHPSVYTNAAIINSSLISTGGMIEGKIEDSSISYRCRIKKGSIIKNSVLHSNVSVGCNVHLEYVLVKENTIISDNIEIIGKPGGIILVTNDYLKTLGGSYE